MPSVMAPSAMDTDLNSASNLKYVCQTCQFSECCNAECHYAECCGTLCDWHWLEFSFKFQKCNIQGVSFLSVVMLSVIMLSVVAPSATAIDSSSASNFIDVYRRCKFSECCYAKCHYAKCCGTLCDLHWLEFGFKFATCISKMLVLQVMLSLIMPVRVSVIMPSVVAPSATDTDSSSASNFKGVISKVSVFWVLLC
jgi:hypothetical protein